MRKWTEVPFETRHTEPKALPPKLAALAQSPRVFVALPSYNGFIKAQALLGLLLPSATCFLHYELGFGSLLATNFNHLLCKARNSRAEGKWTDFGMHHADISAPPGWLDVMVEEKRRVGADILSVVVPIKDERRLTSTGTVQEGGHIRRLTLKEVHHLPETFCAADLAQLGIHTPMVVNTGLMLVDFTRAWSDEFHFSIGDAIQRTGGHQEEMEYWCVEDGRNVLKKELVWVGSTYSPACLPEDWNFSSWANARGLKVYATRKVPVGHWDGGACWDNGKHDDGWITDLGDDPSAYGAVAAVRAKDVPVRAKEVPA